MAMNDLKQERAPTSEQNNVAIGRSVQPLATAIEQSALSARREGCPFEVSCYQPRWDGTAITGPLKAAASPVTETPLKGQKMALEHSQQLWKEAS
jgi:hypothetical protein